MMVRIIWSLLVSIACLCGVTNLAAKSDTVDSGFYTTKDREFYLTPEQLLFIRPGLVLKITSVVIPADRKTEVTFTIADPAGLPLDRTGITTPGPVSTSFILANIPAGEEAYYSYTKRIQKSPITGVSAEQGSADTGGSYTELAAGTYKYKFGTVLPEGYDKDVTHTLGVYASRNLAEFELLTYYDNELYHFVPSGSSQPKARDIVTTETCNGRCHQGLALHGGSRRDIGLCILCHNPNQDIDPDTGNSFDMPLMTHKIHMGAGLANGYNIIGYGQTNHDYSEVIYPAIYGVNECESCHTGGTPTKEFPLVASPSAVPVCDMSGVGTTMLKWGNLGSFEIHMDSASGPLFAASSGTGSTMTGKWVGDGTKFVLVDKATGATLQTLPVNATVNGCVSNPPGAFVGKAATDHTNWLTNPNSKDCGACHDWVNFETGAGHSSNNIAAEDSECALCHKPFVAEFDRSIRGAHMPLYRSAQLPGVLVKLLSVANTNPGDKPKVTFSVSSKKGTIDPGSMDRFRLMLSGPNDDFDFRVQETVGKNAVWAGNNTWTYTFAAALPADAEGSYTVSFEGRANVSVNMGGVVSTQRDVGENPNFAFAVGGGTAKARRQVVDDEKCEACHVNLAFHGGGRHDADLYCATCHMPSAVTDDDAPQTFHFKYMIHSIHRGAELQNGFVIGSDDFSEIEYTGDLRNCEACHVNNSQQLSSMPDGLLPTITPQAWWSPMQPEAAACLSCHDDDDTAVHAYSNTAFFGESCSTCHGAGKAFSVDKVHIN